MSADLEQRLRAHAAFVATSAPAALAYTALEGRRTDAKPPTAAQATPPRPGRWIAAVALVAATAGALVWLGTRDDKGSPPVDTGPDRDAPRTLLVDPTVVTPVVEVLYETTTSGVFAGSNNAVVLEDGRLVVADNQEDRWVVVSGTDVTVVPYTNVAHVNGLVAGPGGIVYLVEGEQEYSQPRRDARRVVGLAADNLDGDPVLDAPFVPTATGGGGSGPAGLTLQDRTLKVSYPPASVTPVVLPDPGYPTIVPSDEGVVVTFAGQTIRWSSASGSLCVCGGPLATVADGRVVTPYGNLVAVLAPDGGSAVLAIEGFSPWSLSADTRGIVAVEQTSGGWRAVRYVFPEMTTSPEPTIIERRVVPTFTDLVAPTELLSVNTLNTGIARRAFVTSAGAVVVTDGPGGRLLYARDGVVTDEVILSPGDARFTVLGPGDVWYQARSDGSPEEFDIVVEARSPSDAHSPQVLTDGLTPSTCGLFVSGLELVRQVCDNVTAPVDERHRLVSEPATPYPELTQLGGGVVRVTTPHSVVTWRIEGFDTFGVVGTTANGTVVLSAIARTPEVGPALFILSSDGGWAAVDVPNTADAADSSYGTTSLSADDGGLVWIQPIDGGFRVLRAGFPPLADREGR